MPEIPPWLSALVSILTPVSFAGWQVYLYITGRFDKREDAREASEDKQLQMLAGQRDRITADLRTDLDTCRVMLEATSRDRYRGWDLARAWYDHAYQFRTGWLAANGEARAARQAAESLARRLPVELAPTWGMPLDGPPPLPPFDMPKG